ncbi:hypothetical protein [Anaerovibrio sp.]|uniref:hypothetical protein n=1 Tax=Anaerovibrio sp. TaxID=1872532 RepID=UPI00388E75C7
MEFKLPKRFFGIVIIFVGSVFLVTNACMAQEVTVTGMGYDRENALRDATRQAVEQVVGTFIDSQTVMKNLTIQLDEVYKKSQGFVKHVTVLAEDRLDDSTYRVKAIVEVDTNPDAKLMDSLTMILRLNDPRIVVAVLEKDDEGHIKRLETAESTLNNRLLQEGFSHVLDIAQVADTHDAPLLKNIYEGKRGELLGEADHAADYLVIGTSTRDTTTVSIPNYKESGMLETSIINVKADLKVDVISYSSGKIVGTFVAQGIGVDNNSNRAGNKAEKSAAEQAAIKIIEIFKGHGAKSVIGMEFILTSEGEKGLQKVIRSLYSLGCVDNIYIREESNNKAVLDIESSQKPHEIVRQLRNTVSYGIAVENITSESCQLRITGEGEAE